MKIAAVASGGGHWIQLQRLLPAFDKHDVFFISTHDSFSSTVPGSAFYSVPNASRWNKAMLIVLFYKVFKIIFIERPAIVISTGAAPGLMAIFAGKFIGSRTIWIDSIANVEKISLSGRLALFISDRVYTQWPHLASKKITYSGNVLS